MWIGSWRYSIIQIQISRHWYPDKLSFTKSEIPFLKWLLMVDMNRIPKVSKQFTHESVQLQQGELKKKKLGWNERQIFHF